MLAVFVFFLSQFTGIGISVVGLGAGSKIRVHKATYKARDGDDAQGQPEVRGAAQGVLEEDGPRKANPKRRDEGGGGAK